MNWISSPLTYYIALGAGLLLSLYLFFSVKREMAELRARLIIERRDMSAHLEAYRNTLEQLRKVLEETPEAAVSGDSAFSLQAAAGASQSIHLTRRSQALRMYRRGESADQIASSLQMPRNEVDLLLKVHQAYAGQ